MCTTFPNLFGHCLLCRFALSPKLLNSTCFWKTSKAQTSLLSPDFTDVETHESRVICSILLGTKTVLASSEQCCYVSLSALVSPQSSFLLQIHWFWILTCISPPCIQNWAFKREIVSVPPLPIFVGVTNVNIPCLRHGNILNFPPYIFKTFTLYCYSMARPYRNHEALYDQQTVADRIV